MKKSSKAIALVLAASAISGPALSDASKPQSYVFEMEVSDNGQHIASPRLIAHAGETAEIGLGQGDGSLYKITMTATPDSASTILFSSKIDISSAKGAPRHAEPKLTVKPNETATIMLGNAGPDQQPFRMDVKLKPIDG